MFVMLVSSLFIQSAQGQSTQYQSELDWTAKHQAILNGDAKNRDQNLRSKALLKEHARLTELRIVPDGEPGEPLKLIGRVQDPNGLPIEDAIVSIFQADTGGFYAWDDAKNGTMDEPNARLFGFVRTDSKGVFVIYTIRPGGYPRPLKSKTGDLWIPSHIHLTVEAPGFQTHQCASTCQLVFSDDARMTPYWQKWAKNGGQPILTPKRSPSGEWFCYYEITLMPG